MEVISKTIGQVITSGRCRVSNLEPEHRSTLTEIGIVLDQDWASLSTDTELLNPEFLYRELRADGLDFVQLEVLSCTESTNTLLLERAQQESIDGHILLAEVQTGGRGRQGRHWISPVGLSVALSLGVRLKVPPAGAGAASLVVGMAVLDALEHQGVPNLELKWPNDVLVNGSKIAGVLVEMVGTGRPVELVVGVGINTGSARFLRKRVEQAITDVSEHVSGYSRNSIVAKTIASVLTALRDFEQDGFDSFAERGNERDALAGKWVCVTTPSEILSGVARGIDSDGALILESEKTQHRIIGGEVSVRAFP